MKKNKIINAASCDARNVTEESLAEFENITINSSVLIVGERSKELLNRHSVMMNVANVVEVPDGENATVQIINGSGEIGPDADGAGVFLILNGKLLIADGSLSAVKSYYRITVNGKVLMPKSFEGQFTNIQINGRTEYYPDGATLLRADTQIDNLFLARAANQLYHCSGNLFFLDPELDTEKIVSKGLKFSARSIVIAEGLLSRLISQFDEASRIKKVPDGTRVIEGDLDLKMKTIKKYGDKLIVTGDVTIADAEPLASLRYLFADGTVKITKALEDAFDDVESSYDELKVIDPDLQYIADRAMVKVGPSMLGKGSRRVQIEDCARVVLSDELTPENIMENLRIRDCAIVVCTKQQEDAVHFISEDVGTIQVADPHQAEDDKGILGSFLGSLKDTVMVNASEYKM